MHEDVAITRHELDEEAPLQTSRYEASEVEYAFHYQRFAAPFLIQGNSTNNLFFTHQAQENHIYGVNNALGALIRDAVALVSIFAFKAEADHFFRYGVMRRLRMISSSFRSLQSIVPPDRTIPLSLQQADDACRDLNAIYIDLLGLLDNYAWTVILEVGTTKTHAPKGMAIGLFKEAMSKNPETARLSIEIARFATWEKEVKERRNPAAHRMPLYVPSSALSPSDIEEYQRLESIGSEALRAEQYETYQDIQTAQRRLGSLIPKFLHDPKGPIEDLYPTLPEDIGNAVLIGRAAQLFLRERCNDRSVTREPPSAGL